MSLMERDPTLKEVQMNSRRGSKIPPDVDCLQGAMGPIDGALSENSQPPCTGLSGFSQPLRLHFHRLDAPQGILMSTTLRNRHTGAAQI
jgi:hypothetical protein